MDDAGNSKRRRGLGLVTTNACTECRKKRAKCDGHKPCGRCASQKNVECVYEIPVRQSKENMRTEIERLRRAQKKSDRILQALVSDDISEQVLDQLRSGEAVETITEKLDTLSSRPSIAGSNITTFPRFSIGSALRPARSIESSPLSNVAFSDTQGSGSQPPPLYEGNIWPSWGRGNNADQQASPKGEPQEDMMKWEPDISPTSNQGPSYPFIGTLDHHSGSTNLPNSTIHYARGQGQETILGQDFGLEELPDEPHPNSNQSWTSITTDGAFVEHLMALYFCWEYPTFASLSKEHFLDDFRRGTPRHCSSLLVNALLALGCRFSNHASARTDPNDSNTAGDHFFAEAVRQLNAQNDRHILTTIQALGLMSIREASCGRSSEGLFLSGQSIRLAIEMGLHNDSETGDSKEDEVEYEVRSATFWGAFSLDQAWSLSIGRLPHFSRDVKLVNKPAVVEHVEASSWVPYTDDGAPLERSSIQPSNVRSVYKTFCELAEIVHKSLYTLYTPGSRVTSKSLLASYTDFLRWYDAIPAVLRLGHNFTPAVLFAHMYYHSAILLLFRPFIKLDIISSSVSPRDVCAQAADAISALAQSYSQLYTLRRTPSFVPYFVLTASIAHLVTLGNGRSGPEQLRQGLADLKEMQSCHGFAVRGLDILRFLVQYWEVHLTPEEGSEELKDIKKMCRPRSTSMNQFCPNVAAPDVVNGIGPAGQDENPLFWPFPFQGRPLLDVGSSLESAGFRISP